MPVLETHCILREWMTKDDYHFSKLYEYYSPHIDLSSKVRHILDSDKSATTQAVEKFDKRVATIKDKGMRMAIQRDKKAMESAFLTTMARVGYRGKLQVRPQQQFLCQKKADGMVDFKSVRPPVLGQKKTLFSSI